MGGSDMKLIAGMGTHPNGGVCRYSTAETGGSNMGFVVGMGMHPSMGVRRYGAGQGELGVCGWFATDRSSAHELGTCGGLVGAGAS